MLSGYLFLVLLQDIHSLLHLSIIPLQLHVLDLVDILLLLILLVLQNGELQGLLLLGKDLEQLL